MSGVRVPHGPLARLAGAQSDVRVAERTVESRLAAFRVILSLPSLAVFFSWSPRSVFGRQVSVSGRLPQIRAGSLANSASQASTVARIDEMCGGLIGVLAGKPDSRQTEAGSRKRTTKKQEGESSPGRSFLLFKSSDRRHARPSLALK
jgi:hypothetical protein